MKFWAYVKQRGEGCDYTIACGEAIWEIEADSWEDAIEEVRLRTVGDPNTDDCEYMGHWTSQHRWREPDLDEIRLVEIIGEAAMPVVEWYAEAVAKRDEAEQLEMERIERARYEELQQKYGN